MFQFCLLRKRLVFTIYNNQTERKKFINKFLSAKIVVICANAKTEI